MEILVTEGTPTVLEDGTRIEVWGVMYAHLADSMNMSQCMARLTKDGASVEKSFSRAHGGTSKEPVPEEAFGWQLTLIMADPYQKPSRAQFLVTRKPR